MSADFYAIEENDRRTFNELCDWWRRQSPGTPQYAPQSPGQAVPMMLLQAPQGWTQGRYCPMVVDPLYPYAYDVCLIGYPAAYQTGLVESGTFRVSWRGVQSEPIGFNATALQFRAALPPGLRDICKVTGGAISEVTPDGRGQTFYPGRWFVSLPERIPELQAVTLNQGNFDTLILRVSESPLAAANDVYRCWALTNRTTAPRIAVGALALGWYTQGIGLMVGVVEPRIYEAYRGEPIYPEPTTTTPAPTTTTTSTTTTPAPTTTAAPTTTTAGPTTTTTPSGVTTTTTPAPTTTTTTTAGPPVVTTTSTPEPTTTTTEDPGATTTTAAPTTTTTGEPTTTTTAAPTTTTQQPTTTTTAAPTTTTTATPTTTTAAPTTTTPSFPTEDPFGTTTTTSTTTTTTAMPTPPPPIFPGL